MDDDIKYCKKCDKYYPLSSFDVRKDYTKLDGSPAYRSMCKECQAADNLQRYYVKGGYKNQAKRSRKHHLKRYQMSVEDYEAMLQKQKGKCAICGLEGSFRGGKSEEHHYRLFVDHCHDTGNVRGLLCHNCNAGLGHFRDNISLLEKAVRYINESSIRHRD